jgi:phospholipid/cholesterol/gamma-HCH transport system substrate-binding protein
MEQRSLHLRVGLFVLGGIVLTAALGVLALDSRLGEAKATYLIQFRETVKGMVKGSAVNFQGVPIGVVTDMRFVSGVTEVVIEVDPLRAQIQKATRANLDRAWVTGQVTVELFGWAPDGAPLAEHGIIKADLSTGAQVMASLPDLAPRALTVLEEVSTTARTLHELLRPESKLIERLNGVLERADTFLAQGSDRTLPELTATLHEVRELAPVARRAIDDLAAMSRNLAALSGDPAWSRLLAEGSGLVAEARAEIPKLGRAGAEAEALMRGSRREVQRTLADLGAALHELQGLLRLLQGAPSALVFGRVPPAGDLRDIRVPALPAAAPAGGDR